MSKQQNAIDLINLFASVAQTLASHQESLNEADAYNHDHGTNMVNTFQAITKAMQQAKTAAPADQLAYASQALSRQKSGSAQLYAQGLARASQQFQGQQQVTPDNAMMLVNALLGAGQTAAAASSQPSGTEDLLSALLGLGGQAPAAQQGGSGDLLSSLLGAAEQPQAPAKGQKASKELGESLLNAGIAFMSAKARGGSNLEAAINALVQGSAIGSSSAHRAQSSALVVSALLQAISAMSQNK